MISASLHNTIRRPLLMRSEMIPGESRKQQKRQCEQELHDGLVFHACHQKTNAQQQHQLLEDVVVERTQRLCSEETQEGAVPVGQGGKFGGACGSLPCHESTGIVRDLFRHYAAVSSVVWKARVCTSQLFAAAAPATFAM